MITAILEYCLPTPCARSAVLEKFKQAENRFRGMAGLQRKYFCYDEASGLGLSVYLWDSKTAAEAVFTEAFISGFESGFGVRPSIRCIDTLMIVDNAADAVVVF
ncbi:hypothetical protein QTI33_10915 [Variovorax sp. J22P271]|uniref:hypothetical protein n=1 Tax=Variovorax davisae TaxID=3053515 RepID=UPI002576EBB0|nr:hypothetical protein [Variovorax sp. J22P271]MDM0032637.1 hypothetical protein [Variovorax sp. J22P271]